MDMLTLRYLQCSKHLYIVLLFLLLQFCSSLQKHAEEHNLDQVDVESVVKRAFTDSQGSSSLSHRRKSSCSADEPCPNGECCAANGICGYGPTFCGMGCISNCNAQAECGVRATPSNKTCPLNACCGSSGTCGNEPELCDRGCQSNCFTDEKPGLPRGHLWDRVVGYYDIETALSRCRNQTAAIPLWSDYTHLNLAYAEVDGGSLELIPTNPSMPNDSFKLLPDLKSHTLNDLKVFISVRGRTSSNGYSATQSTFVDIAASPHSREVFATKALRFLNKYGFDGIDIHWEHPTVSDTANYVALLKTLRTTFDNAGRYLGITFTAAATYRDLRWYDIPNMLKYSDWLNLLSYNLPGVHDEYYPSNNIVRSHSSLKELKNAVELLWRVKVPPAQVVIGLGLFGRSFELTDPQNCSSPGCQFRPGAKPGPCSMRSDYMPYYEIMDLLKRPDIRPVHDVENAFMYFTYDQDKWVSFDDGSTFTTKLDWANNLGLGGFLVWATNLDDRNYTGHSAIFRNNHHLLYQPQGELNNTLYPRGLEYIGEPANFDFNSIPSYQIGQGVINWDRNQTTYDRQHNIVGLLGDRCTVETHDGDGCQDLHNISCPTPGYMKVAGEKGKCGGQSYHSVCCPKDLTPPGWTGVQNNASDPCRWSDNRDWHDCAGECNPGEVATLHSSWGGYPNQGEGEFKCGRGYKVLCCKSPWYIEATKGCRLTPCQDSRNVLCEPSEDRVGNVRAGCPGNTLRAYCCPKKTRLYDCSWRGNLDQCVNPECQPDELTVLTDKYGDNFESGSNAHCHLSRYRSFCCKVRPPPPPIICAPVCSYNKTYCDYEPGFAPKTHHRRSPGKGKGKGVYKGDQNPALNDPEGYPEAGSASGNSRSYAITGPDGRDTGSTFTSQQYPPSSQLYGYTAFPPDQRPIYEIANIGDCSSAFVSERQYTEGTSTAGLETEHPVDRNLIADFIGYTTRGTIPGATTGSDETPAYSPRINQVLPAIPESFWVQSFHHTGDYQYPGGSDVSARTPNDLLANVLGSSNNLQHLAATEKSINQVKARVVRIGVAPYDENDFAQKAYDAAQDSEGRGADELISDLKTLIAVFQYLRSTSMYNRYVGVLSSIAQTLAVLETNSPEARRVQISEWWETWLEAYQTRIVSETRDWTFNAIHRARQQFEAGTADNTQEILKQLNDLEQQVDQDIQQLPHYDQLPEKRMIWIS